MDMHGYTLVYIYIYIYIYIYRVYTKICARALGRVRSLLARKHRTCRALATLAFEKTAPAVLWPLWRSTVGACLLENTAPAVLWPLWHSKTPHLPCFGPFGARKHRTCRALAPLALAKTPHLPCFGHFGARENTAPAVLWPLWRSKTPHLPSFGPFGARKHRTCRALAT
jgi:hypothetical protein